MQSLLFGKQMNILWACRHPKVGIREILPNIYWKAFELVSSNETRLKMVFILVFTKLQIASENSELRFSDNFEFSKFLYEHF